MATATRTRKPKTPVYKSKTAEAIALMKGEDPAFLGVKMKVKDVEKEMTRRGRPMGYAFIYGRAKANGLAETAANRRATKSLVKNEDGTVTHHFAGGAIATVNYAENTITITGSVSVVKARAARKAR